VLVACALGALALAAPAGAAGLRISMLGQTQSPAAGSPWAYYLRVLGPNKKPWRGQISIDVVSPKGKRIDFVGQFAFSGSMLAAYIWNAADKGRTLDFHIRFLQGKTTIASTAYRVHVV
jgi:hypothetical protein